MPFNLLLLPLLAGFVFIARAHIFSYATSLHTKEALLLYASLAGLLFLGISRLLCVGLASTSLGADAVGVLHSIVPFDYIGTSVGTLLIAGTLVLCFNALVPSTLASFWLYHCDKFNALESVLLRSAFGVAPSCRHGRAKLMWRQLLRRDQRDMPVGNPELVMISTRDGKVYVGYIGNTAPLQAAQLDYIRILPIWSGYRNATKEVVMTTDYDSVVRARVQQGDELSMYYKVVPFKEIVSANMYVHGAFEITKQFNSPPQGTTAAPKKDDGTPQS